MPQVMTEDEGRKTYDVAIKIGKVILGSTVLDRRQDRYLKVVRKVETPSMYAPNKIVVIDQSSGEESQVSEDYIIMTYRLHKS